MIRICSRKSVRGLFLVGLAVGFFAWGIGTSFVHAANLIYDQPDNALSNLSNSYYGPVLYYFSESSTYEIATSGPAWQIWVNMTASSTRECTTDGGLYGTDLMNIGGPGAYANTYHTSCLGEGNDSFPFTGQPQWIDFEYAGSGSPPDISTVLAYGGRMGNCPLGSCDAVLVNSSLSGYTALKIYDALPDTPSTVVSGTLQQFKSDATTPLAEGAATLENTVVFGAAIQSSTSTDPLQFQVDVEPSSQGFSGNPIAVASTSEGLFATTTVSGLANGTYHWAARVYDPKPMTYTANPWQPFSSSTVDFAVVDGLAQTSPTVFEDATTTYSENNQYSGGCCGGTILGHIFYHAPESFPIQSVQVSLTDSSVNNHDGAGGIQALIYDTDGNLIASSTNGIYAEGSCGSCSFNFNGERIPHDFEFALLITSDLQGSARFSVGDFRFVALPPLQIISGTLGQFQSDGATAIAESGTTPENTVTFGAELASTGTSTVQLQVEVEPSSTPFTDTQNAASVFVPPGTFAYATSSVLADGAYHWQVRVMDAGNNTSTWQVFNSGAANTDFVVSAVPEIVNQPQENVVCPNLSPSVKNLVFITHGWNDNATDPNGWVQQMAGAIQSKLPDSSWGVCAFDWSQDATTVAPWNAYNNAHDLGLFVGELLAQQNYTTIHFIAHSAGANLIQSAANWIRTNVSAQSQPKIQLTFLDAYDPGGSPSFYGKDPESSIAQYNTDTNWWAEQYVDMRTDPNHLLDDTNIILSNAYNFDVTALDPQQGPTASEQAEALLDGGAEIEYAHRIHQWPHFWYQESITSATPYSYGFPRSLEGGDSNLPVRYYPGGDCVLTAENSSCSTAPTITQNIGSYAGVLDLQAVASLGNAESSVTGVTSYPDANSIILTTDSPVWVKLPITTTTSTDVMQFDYQFLSASGSQGMASISVDNQQVYEIDERVTPAGLNTAKDVWIGNLAPGNHMVSIRLDPFTSVHSVLEISNVQLGSLEQEKIADTVPPATTAVASGTLGLNGWYASDVSVALNAADNPGGSGVAQTSYSFDDGPIQIYSTSTPISIASEGAHTLQYSSVDFFGNQEATNTLSIKIDKTSPITSHSAIAFSTLLNAASISFNYSATDFGSGIASTTAMLDGQPLAASTTLNFNVPGPHVIVITAADLAGNVASTTINYSVNYGFGGFQPPVKADGSGIYNLGRTLPLKFSLADANENIITSAVAQLVVTNVQSGVVGTVPVTLATSTNDTGNLFRVSDSQYIYDFDTGQLTSGTWQIKVELDDGSSDMVLVSLR